MKGLSRINCIRLTAIALITGWSAVFDAARADVLITGVEDPLKSNVLAHMRLDDEACDQDPVRIRHRFDSAPANIRTALRPFGYYHVNIEADLDQSDGECWQAVFRIDPGKPVLYGEVRIEVRGEGGEMAAFQSLVAQADLRTGEQLSHADYEAIKSQLLVAVREYGFFDSELLTSELKVDLDTRRADVTLILDTGARYRFGELHINGDILNEEFLKRYVGFEVGAPFEQRRIRQLHNDLVRGDYFASVDIRTQTLDNNVADIVLTLEEGRRIRYGVGVGFGTDTGLIVRGDMVVRRVNRRGHRLELDTELSTARQNATFDYRMPGMRPQKDWYSVYGGLSRRDSEAIESIGWKTGIRENRFHNLNWSSAPFLELTAEHFRQDGEWSTSFALVPGWGINFIAADAADRPTRGIRLRGEVAGASSKVLSDASFIRFLFNGKTILPLSRRGRLLLRGEAGWMATSDFDDVPPDWRFYAGGDRSVRGYDYQALGPLDDEGRAIGGQELLTGSIEGDWRAFGNWSGAVFVDAGNVGEGDLLRDLPWSVGFGVRWYSPVGPIRLDLAFPQQGEDDFRVHVSMGPDL